MQSTLCRYVDFHFLPGRYSMNPVCDLIPQTKHIPCVIARKTILPTSEGDIFSEIRQRVWLEKQLDCAHRPQPLVLNNGAPISCASSIMSAESCHLKWSFSFFFLDIELCTRSLKYWGFYVRKGNGWANTNLIQSDPLKNDKIDQHSPMIGSPGSFLSLVNNDLFMTLL